MVTFNATHMTVTVPYNVDNLDTSYAIDFTIVISLNDTVHTVSQDFMIEFMAQDPCMTAYIIEPAGDYEDFHDFLIDV